MSFKQITKQNENKTDVSEIKKKNPYAEGLIKNVLRKVRNGTVITLVSLMVATGCQNNHKNPVSINQNDNKMHVVSQKSNTSPKIMCYDKNNNPVWITVEVTPKMRESHKRYMKGEHTLGPYNAILFSTAADKASRNYGLKCDTTELISKIIENLDE